MRFPFFSLKEHIRNIYLSAHMSSSLHLHVLLQPLHTVPTLFRLLRPLSPRSLSPTLLPPCVSSLSLSPGVSPPPLLFPFLPPLRADVTSNCSVRFGGWLDSARHSVVNDEGGQAGEVKATPAWSFGLFGQKAAGKVGGFLFFIF